MNRLIILLISFALSSHVLAQSPVPVPAPVPASVTVVTDTGDAFSEVMAIVYRNSQALLGKQSAMGIQSATSQWASSLKLIGGYADKTSQDFASGIDGRAVLTFEYPLTGAKSVQTDMDQAKAMAEIYTARDNLVATVLTELQKIQLLRLDFDAVNNQHQLNMDMLAKLKDANSLAKASKKEFEQKDTTPYLDKAMQSNSALLKADFLLRSQVEVVARTYGGKEWKELLVAMKEYLKEMGKWK
ncbi:MAG: hypothetical protein BWK79_04925 [Beggiatoa sp. IS2]|nr:MAG: hypothetical protein BWK79_04925 [Beggiatoa sp. IS2]